MNPNRILGIVKKCSVNNHPEWCGCLQPAEIVILIDELKCSVDKFHEVYVQRARDNKTQGICNPTWFYFYPSKYFMKHTNQKDK